MYHTLVSLHERPAPFSRYTTDRLWTDEHISERMLAAHLAPEHDLASRRPETIDAIVGWMDDRVGLAGRAVTDLGCGPGLYATRMAARGATVTGLDFSPRSIAYARRAAVGQAGLSYVQADYLRDPLPQGQDLVCLIYGDLGVLSPDQRRALYGRIRRALKPGGHFICDAFTAPQFAEREEQVICARRLMDGFWAPGDYFGFLHTFLYHDLRLSLDRYLIVEPARTWEVFNWLQHFEPAELAAELGEAGYEVVATVDAVTGRPWRPAPRELAVVARV